MHTRRWIIKLLCTLEATTVRKSILERVFKERETEDGKNAYANFSFWAKANEEDTKAIAFSVIRKE